MKKAVGLLLILAGAAVMGVGGYRALTTLSGLYQSNIDNALNQPEGAEKATSDRMIKGVTIGAIGVPVFLTGYVVWKMSRQRGRTS